MHRECVESLFPVCWRINVYDGPLMFVVNTNNSKAFIEKILHITFACLSKRLYARPGSSCERARGTTASAQFYIKAQIIRTLPSTINTQENTHFNTENCNFIQYFTEGIQLTLLTHIITWLRINSAVSKAFSILFVFLIQEGV